MKRLHVNLAVSDLEVSIRFYSQLFGAEPTVREVDYAKWLLDDPRVNFAITDRIAEKGVHHLGIQVEDEAELEAVRTRMRGADATLIEEGRTVCCYAKSDKTWAIDPDQVAWEAFLTTAASPTFSAEAATADSATAGTAAGCC